ncbi:MAG: DMT family transporter [Paracoccus sp. (in: a-proteobacteria)]|nr:DMT family transporter [Paracoccus sp. (in: a-proteobacteria)]
MRALPRAFALMGQSSDGTRRPSGDGGHGAGIMLLLAAVFVFTLMDAVAKHLGETYAAPQIVWARFAGNLLFLMLFYRARFFPSLRSRHPRLQFWRSMMQLGSSLLFFTAIQHIGIAEATAIMDLNPVLITLGAALFLGEPIGWRRIAGIVAALSGALIIIRPGMDVFHPAAVLPLIGAFTYAAGALLTRFLRDDALATSLIWSVLMGTLISSLMLPWFWQPVQIQHLWAFGIIGVLGAVSQALLIRAFSMAEAGAIAPFGYTGLLWAGVWSWLFWGVIPDRWTIIGAAIIVVAGIYVWSREARAARRPPADSTEDGT